MTTGDSKEIPAVFDDEEWIRVSTKQPPPVRYAVVSEGALCDLIERVNAMMATGCGWHPVGGVAIAKDPYDGSPWILQAMIKGPISTVRVQPGTVTPAEFDAAVQRARRRAIDGQE